eukprot:TRINITY_DN105161_c0_g1_i1.p1 TRINITY_DN105161_c0_g1~~TRINITY_DN105161_c0_g1_i1.p1  ORF type:complete len:568 (+),score=69.68 TRINITY_DN105161_c0_g1_i1:33-1736(+)
MRLQHPREAQDPAGFCERADLFQKLAGEKVPVPGPPVLWLAPRAPHLRRPLERGTTAVLAPLPHAPLWWAGGPWRDFGAGPEAAVHAQAHAAYVPRRFEPPWRCGSMLVRPTEAPLEGDGVVQMLKVLLCKREGRLWTKPVTGGDWRECPFDLDFQLLRTEAIELLGGDRYLFLFRGPGAGAGGLDSVLFYKVVKNEFVALASERPTARGHGGEVQWQPLRGEKVAPAPLKAWLLEGCLDYVMLLAPVSRDGHQRGVDQNVHTAVHFIGTDGKEVVHHLPCSAEKLSAQRYQKHFLFAKDFDEDAGDERSSVRHDISPEYNETAGWLLDAEDASVPPLPVLLPISHSQWGGAAWSLVLARGTAEELAPSTHLRFDAAPRIWMLEEGPVLRLWATRRVDDAMKTLHQRHTLDGTSFLRHALSFSPLEGTELEVTSQDVPGAWLLWAPDLQHVARLAASGRGSGKLGFWRCGVAFSEQSQLIQASHRCALRSGAQIFADPHPVHSQPLSYHAWSRCSMPAEDARRGVLTGQPCFPTHVRGDGTFARPKDHWRHPCGREATQLPPLSSLR